jgi:NAD(P)-dependent dehydrogenase (short-subunit alcohol dehydrogenase family)
VSAEISFDGKVALVTGAATGIGLATATAFAESGAAVALAGIHGDAIHAAAEGLAAAGHRTIGIACDVTDETSVASLVTDTVATFGGLDVAFNNAGIQAPVAETAEATGEDFDRVIAINLRGVWNCLKHELRHMRQHGSGAIVNCSSQSGLVGTAGLGAYTASKHGVLGLTKCAALEYAARGIRINAICPGPTDTPMVAAAMADHPDHMAALVEGIPVGRLGRPEEIASAVLWLCSPGAGFVIGQYITADGGLTTQ